MHNYQQSRAVERDLSRRGETQWQEKDKSCEENKCYWKSCLQELFKGRECGPLPQDWTEEELNLGLLQSDEDQTHRGILDHIGAPIAVFGGEDHGLYQQLRDMLG